MLVWVTTGQNLAKNLLATMAVNSYYQRWTRGVGRGWGEQGTRKDREREEKGKGEEVNGEGAGQWLGDGSDQEAGKRAICEQGKVEGEGGGGR